jgi:hypothetical protein
LRLSVEFNFYIVLNGRLSAEQAQAVRDNLRDFSVKVVDSPDATGLSGTALVMGSADSEWFKTNRPNLTVVELRRWSSAYCSCR